jgi:hypothetical protein
VNRKGIGFVEQTVLFVEEGKEQPLWYNIPADKIGKVSFVKCNLCSGWKSKHSCVVIPTHLWAYIDCGIDLKVVDY